MSEVSVVVPIYNASKTLNKCITSILNQTFKNIELILVNDGSTDDSLNICKKYEKMDKRIYIINSKNEGSIAARNKGIEKASSEYIMFVDADDWIDKEMIESLYNEIMGNSADIVICNSKIVLGLFKQKNRNIYFEKDKTFNKDDIKKNLVVAYFHGHPFPANLWGKLYKKNLFLNSGKYLDRIHFLGDDLFYNMELLLKANKVKIICKYLYYYRAGGFTNKYMPFLFEDIINGYKIQKEVIDEYFIETRQIEYNGISVMLLNMLKSSLYNLFISNLNSNEIKEIIKEYVSNESIRECLKNEGSVKYFPEEYLNAIELKDIQYLFNLGETIYKKKKIKKIIKNLIIKLSLIQK